MSDKGVVDFSTGSIAGKLIAFMLPLLLGNLFQQLYNAADTLIVGNFLGPDALAAVSSSGSLIFMMVGFFNGMAVGAGVVISRAYGAGDRDRLKRAISSDIAFGILAGLAITLFAVLFTPSILRWISTPDSLLPISAAYFRIYSAGIFFSVMYNVLMGVMNALGDSRHPLYYLIISSLINIVLDLLFVGVLGMGVGSAALATIVSQAASSLLCLRHLIKGVGDVSLDVRAIRLDARELRSIIRFGLPSGMQNSIVGFANTVIQASVNGFPAAAIAGFGVYAKIEGFVLLPITSFSLAFTTFIAQMTATLSGIFAPLAKRRSPMTFRSAVAACMSLFQNPMTGARLFLRTAASARFATVSGGRAASLPQSPWARMYSFTSSRVGMAPGRTQHTLALPVSSVRRAEKNCSSAFLVALYRAK